MSVAAWRPRLCEQPAAGAFPLVIGSLRFDLTVVRKPSSCRADERPLMWAPVGRVTAAPGWRGAISGRRRPRIHGALHRLPGAPECGGELLRPLTQLVAPHCHIQGSLQWTTRHYM